MRASSLSGPGWGGPAVDAARPGASNHAGVAIDPVVDTGTSHGPGWAIVDDDGSGAGDDTATTLSVPASVDSLVLVRVVVGGVAAQEDLSVDVTEDLQLVVDEACLVLLEAFTGVAGRDGRLDLSFSRSLDDTLRVTVHRPGARPSGPSSEVTTLVLDALTSDWSIEDTDGGPTVRIAIDAVPHDRR